MHGHPTCLPPVDVRPAVPNTIAAHRFTGPADQRARGDNTPSVTCLSAPASPPGPLPFSKSVRRPLCSVRAFALFARGSPTTANPPREAVYSAECATVRRRRFHALKSRVRAKTRSTPTRTLTSNLAQEDDHNADMDEADQAEVDDGGEGGMDKVEDVEEYSDKIDEDDRGRR